MLPIAAFGWLGLVYILGDQLPTFTGPAHTWLTIGYFLTLAESLVLTSVSLFPRYLLGNSYPAHLEPTE